MKQLSIEEKAKRYDEALKKACQLCDYPTSKPFISDLQDLFPELKESEDERTWIINYLSNRILNSTIIAEKENLKKAVAWLEKQGEQNPTDKVEPKFKAGDWIIHQGTENVYQVVARIYNQYQLKYGDNYTIQNCADVDRCARLWDVEKKELKKIEQKPAWSEEDEKKRRLLINILKVNHPNDYFKVNPVNTLNMEAMSTEELVSWLKSLKNRYTWKPSDEQIKAIKWVIDGDNPENWSITLKNLYQDLKKLKG